MKYIIQFFILLTIISCKNSTNTKHDKVVNQNINNKNLFKILNDSDYDLEKLDYHGKILNKKFWHDTNGKNIVLFTKNESEIYVYHYLVKSKESKLLRKVYDFVKECDLDLTLEFIENSITVTDLDKNNIGEITFAYRIACISDVTPKQLKLLILENGNKYIIRGNTIINLGNQEIGGDKNVDSSFENASEEFILHANKVWSMVVKE